MALNQNAAETGASSVVRQSDEGAEQGGSIANKNVTKDARQASGFALQLNDDSSPCGSPAPRGTHSGYAALRGLGDASLQPVSARTVFPHTPTTACSCSERPRRAGKA